MPLKLESLQGQIEKKSAEWEAAETSLSSLSNKEQESFLGLNVTKEEIKSTESAIKAVESMQETLASFHADAFAAPTSVDWRNHNGNYTTTIKNQSSCGSCVSFATIATIESRMEIACKNPNLNPDYSEAFLFYCGCGQCCNNGWNFPPALNYCKNTGVARDSDFPYTPGNQPCKSGVTPQFKITNWTSVLSMAERKSVIAEKGPVVGGLAIYQDFYSYKSGVYKHVTGNLVGYHAVSVVGYDDNLGCWICKNSWGTNWGDNGWFKIAYGQAGMDTQFAFYDVDLNCAQPTPQPVNCSRYVPYLRRVLQLARTNFYLRMCLRRYICKKPTFPFPCPATYMNIVKLVDRILKICPQYHAPFCRLLG